ncbi:MAG TPA: sensor histidine kinase [Candidatus Dormibacteraeota bacterium]|nr:sensor histidine kinase [Candidatus Dormibacteraeota bacterium]
MTLAPHELRLGRLLMVAFLLIFLHRALTTALTERGGRLALLALLVFGIAAVYGWFWLRVAGGARDEHAALAVVALTVLVGLYVLTVWPDAYVFYYPAIVAGAAFRWDRSLVFLAGVIAAAFGLAVLQGSGVSAATDTAIVMLLLGASAIAVRRHVATTKRLEAARDEIHRLAARDERLRVARDLHDELGQTLSLIVLKCELAQLEAAGPARERMEEVTGAARQALRGLRDLVSSFRQPTLAEELDAARSLLEASGIECVVESRPAAISPPVEAALAWAVREASTNVLRHSGCRRCRFSVERRNGAVHLEVADDGGGAQPFEPGSGLRGLEERVAFLGGRLEAASTPGGGFRVQVGIPCA